VNFFDTAEGHPAALSETFLGQAIKRFGWKQTDLVISTKVSRERACVRSLLLFSISEVLQEQLNAYGFII
jgi:aryl-alcohol dehydrogenase-like predicted oxidoreductase